MCARGPETTHILPIKLQPRREPAGTAGPQEEGGLEDQATLVCTQLRNMGSQVWGGAPQQGQPSLRLTWKDLAQCQLTWSTR